MASRAQGPLSVATPLGPDALLLVSFSGAEAISSLFSFHLGLVAGNDQDIPFDQLIAQDVAVTLALPGRAPRFFSGICAQVGQGARGVTFTSYQMELVPKLWLLTRNRNSRIFQNKSVPDILAIVLGGASPSFQLQGTYFPRNYCVQYRESDFNFASRLMEEEGIFYFFIHAADGHKLVVADSPAAHPDVPDQRTLPFDRATSRGPVIFEWEKTQELRAGKSTLRDHSFQLPQNNLEVQATIQETLQSGQVTHKLKVGGNDQLEIYDYPGEYAKRFDGVDPAGGDRSSDLERILPDGQRTVGIRMQQEAVLSLAIDGASTAGNLVSGDKFALTGHFNANGEYILTSVKHSAERPDPQSTNVSYSNTFTCIPSGLPFRPPRATPKPVIPGTQTAVVVGPSGEEIFTDKYGRVKVQFFWDREGKRDANSSCWIRVAQMPTGGSMFIPRIGQEVIVAFEEGDPDRPLVLGSVYNADQLPPPFPKQSS